MAKNKHPLLYRNIKLYLKQTPTRGRGVFCLKDIKKGEELEITPGLILDAEATGHINKTRLKDYAFETGRISKSLAAARNIKNREDSSCVVMGITSFCNHSDSPNAEVLWEESMNMIYFTLRATRAIKKGSEICTSYGPTWFDGRGLKKT